jgi:NitT/TauT family transport system substrate-binding protein
MFDREIYTEIYNIAASKELIERRPETARRFLRALIKAEAFVAQHPDEAQAIVAAAAKLDPGLVREVWKAFNYVVRLDQALLISLEDEARWAMKNKLTDVTVMPDFRKVIHAECLRSVRPESVKANL